MWDSPKPAAAPREEPRVQEKHDHQEKAHSVGEGGKAHSVGEGDAQERREALGGGGPGAAGLGRLGASGRGEESAEAIALAAQALKGVVKNPGAATGGQAMYKHHDTSDQTSAQRGGGGDGALEPRGMDDEEATVYDKVIHLQRERLKEMQRDKERAERAAREAQALVEERDKERLQDVSQRARHSPEEGGRDGRARRMGPVEEELLRCV